jgi:hypothetical protein
VRRVFKQSLSVRDMTPPMRNPAERRLEERGRSGWWPHFPSSPLQPHDRWRAVLGLDRLFVCVRGCGDGGDVGRGAEPGTAGAWSTGGRAGAGRERAAGEQLSVDRYEFASRPALSW